MTLSFLDERPLVVAIAGPNGAGKTTFFHAHVAPSGLRLVNADVLAAEFAIDAYAAASLAAGVRRELVAAGESFAFETVFSDPVGDKVGFLEECAAKGYTTALLFVGLTSASLSAQRVAMRVSQGGHDVPAAKLRSRFPRTLANLRAAINRLPHSIVYDNSDLAAPFRMLATFEHGNVISRADQLPAWFRRVVR